LLILIGQKIFVTAFVNQTNIPLLGLFIKPTDQLINP